MSNPKISVIIPILNGEPFIKDCLSFLKAQSFRDFEIIAVIDTRSSDKSLELMQEGLKEFPFSQILLQDKGYRQGGNRNVGLNVAQGEYLWFYDVDDAPTPFFLESMNTVLDLTGADFACCNFRNVGKKKKIKKAKEQTQIRILNQEEAITFCNLGKMPIAPWGKVFRTDFLKENHIEFQDIGAEDVLFTYVCLKACRKVSVYDKELYAYRQTQNSICRSTIKPDLRGQEEIASYCRVDEIFQDNWDVLVHSAVMKMRSSTHMTFKSAITYAKSDINRYNYDHYLKGFFEAGWNLHLPRLYFLAVRVYIKLVYKRNGSRGVNMKTDLGNLVPYASNPA